jgi:hypothetical protein
MGRIIFKRFMEWDIDLGINNKNAIFLYYYVFKGNG